MQDQSVANSWLERPGVLDLEHDTCMHLAPTALDLWGVLSSTRSQLFLFKLEVGGMRHVFWSERCCDILQSLGNLKKW